MEREKKALRFGSRTCDKKRKNPVQGCSSFCNLLSSQANSTLVFLSRRKHWTFISRPYSCCFFFTAFLPFLSSKLL